MQKILYTALLSVMLMSSTYCMHEKDHEMTTHITLSTEVAPVSNLTQEENVSSIKINPLEYELNKVYEYCMDYYLTNHGQILRPDDVDYSNIPESFKIAAREVIYLMHDDMMAFDSIINGIARSYEVSSDDVRKLYKDCNYLCLEYQCPEEFRYELDRLFDFEITRQAEIVKLAIEQFEKYTAEQQPSLDEIDDEEDDAYNPFIKDEPNPFDEVD